MFRFLRIERPITATDRPHSPATSIACCIRWMFEANDEIRTRPRFVGMICLKASPTTRSERVKPGRSAFVESPSRRSTPRFPSSARRPTSVRRPSTGVWSSFQSPVWNTRPAEVSRQTPTASGTECDIRTSSTRNGPSSIGPESGPASRSSEAFRSPCSSSFDFTSPRVRRVAITERTRISRNRYGQRPDVILVRMGEDDRQNVATGEVPEVGKDQVDAEVLVAREGKAGVDHDRLTPELEDGHVLPDLTEASERDDP